MTADPKFTIKIGVLGCESTGKSTVVNAICSALCSETGWGRTTAGINVLRLTEAGPSQVPNKETSLKEEGEDNRKRPPEETGGPDKKRLCSVFKAYGKIQDKNRRFANGGGCVSTMDVIVQKLPITMREDCQLVLVEAPGLNISKSHSQESRAYFGDNWESLDAVIYVMDSQEKVDHEDQLENLKLIHELQKKKELPCFVLCNKVDDPDSLSSEEEHKLQAARSHVQAIWNVECREKALDQLLNSGECSKYENVFPVFLPVSAKTAFLLRAGASMTREDFANPEKMAKEYYHSLGLQTFGRTAWKGMDDEEKASSVHELLLDAKNYKDILRMSGFDKFLESLEKLLGGKRTQTAFIRKNFSAELTKDNFGEEDLYPKLKSLNSKRQIIGETSDQMIIKVWTTYHNKWKQPAIEALERDCKPGRLAFAAQKLVEYQKFCKEMTWDVQMSKIQEEMRRLVQLLLSTINNKANRWSYHVWQCDSSDTDGRWMCLSPIDWQNILSSIMLLRCQDVFCEHFGREMILFEKLLSRFQVCSLGCIEGCDEFPCRDHENLGDSVKVSLDEQMPFEITPADAGMYARLNTVEIPASYKDCQNHFGHVGWLFCKSMMD